VIQLRPYQLEGERRIRQAFADGFKAPLYVLSTGGGKTITFSSIAHSAERRGRRVLIMCHRVELVEQIVESLKNFDVMPDIVAAGYSRGGRVNRHANQSIAVASVQTLVRRLTDFAPPTLIVCDEAHHCVGGNSWAQIMQAYPNAKRLGVTATPCRLDGRGLGTHFDTLVRGPSEQELIDGGYLVRTRIFAPKLIDTSGLHVRMGDFVIGESEALMDKPAITGSALSHYMQHTPHEQGLVFCTSVKHAENVAAQFRDGGVPALMVCGNTDKTLRRDIFRDYRAGKIRMLTAADLFSEGVDCPGARVGIMLRPTQSLALYRQQKGRTMRPAPDKPYATLLDCVRNCERPGFELLPGEIDDWQLGEDAQRKKRKPPPGVKICPKCFASSSPQAVKCSNKGPPQCPHVFVVKSRDIDNREGEIHEVTPEELAARAAKRALGFEQFKADTPEKLAEVFRKKGYKGNLLGRAKHVLEARAAKKLKESA
jgi:DNA repair protein RadD